MKEKIIVSVCDPDEGIDYKKEVFVQEEWIVPCNWCGAKVGEPCYERCHPYKDKVHDIRRKEYLKNLKGEIKINYS